MAITNFTGQFSWLNNSFTCDVELDNEIYPSVEHAYQAAKTGDFLLRNQVKTAQSLREARSLGRGFQLPPDWETKKYNIMYELVHNKFNNNLDLKLRLLLTWDTDLVQGSMRSDQYWGTDYNGVGENQLGKILMAVREEIRSNEGSAESVFCNFLASHNLSFVADKFSQMKEQLLVNDNYSGADEMDNWD